MDENNTQVALFCCENSAYIAANAVIEQLPPGVKILKVPCGGRVERVQILQALKYADGVLILVCLTENCKHSRGNLRAEKRTGYVQELIGKAGIAKERIGYGEVAANDVQKFLQLVNNFCDQLHEKGSIEGKVK